MSATPIQAPGRAGSALFQHPGVAWPSLGLLLLLWGLLLGQLAWFPADPLALLDHPSGWARLLAHMAIGALALNLSFTVWHDAVHGLVFRPRWANDLVGWLGAFPAFIPWFTIRRGHLLHHAHTNHPELDPDHWFLGGSLWSLPLRYPEGIRRTRRLVEAGGQPAAERWADRGQLLLALLAAVGLAYWVHPLAVLFGWFLPKGIAMWIHAWYVNVLPHRGLPPQRFLDTRILDLPWLAPLFLMHQYHGLHHAWAGVPWYRYRRAFLAKQDDLIRRGAPIQRGFTGP